MALTVLHGALTDIGRRRPHNEDCYCADAALGLYAVCDGMGGTQAGEVASSLAVETLHRHIRDASRNEQLPLIGPGFPRHSPRTNRLASAVRAANLAVYEAASQTAEWSGMGTTVVAIWIEGTSASVAHVGDSRLYLIRRETIRVLTSDHSWVAEQVQFGFMTEADAERSPRRHMLTRALGVTPHVDVTVGEFALHPGDLLVLCSDGLTSDVRPATILGAMTETLDMSVAAHRLIALANEAGGDDNITVVTLAIRETGEATWWHRLRQRIAG
ncbi:MAG: Stp1/IreP family PP2C-type Ser/Thr phosphatase [Nitrospira sp.]